jgi:hypothetical protein
VKDGLGEPERGEWIGADKISSRRTWELQQDERGFRNTSPTQLSQLAKTTQPLEWYWP